MLLLGGIGNYDASITTTETWNLEWSNWEQLHPAYQMPALAWSSMAYAPGIGLILYGGTSRFAESEVGAVGPTN